MHLEASSMVFRAVFIGALSSSTVSADVRTLSLAVCTRSLRSCMTFSVVTCVMNASTRLHQQSVSVGKIMYANHFLEVIILTRGVCKANNLANRDVVAFNVRNSGSIVSLIPFAAVFHVNSLTLVILVKRLTFPISRSSTKFV